MTASVQESLARLQLSYVDLIQCHDIEFTQLDQARKGPPAARPAPAPAPAVLTTAVAAGTGESRQLASCRCRRRPLPLAAVACWCVIPGALPSLQPVDEVLPALLWRKGTVAVTLPGGAAVQLSYCGPIAVHPHTASQIVNETLPALLKLKEHGLVRHIGITGLPLKIYKYVLDRWAAHAGCRRAEGWSVPRLRAAPQQPHPLPGQVRTM